MNIAPESLMKRYNIELQNATPLEIMESIANRRGCILKRGEFDYTKTSNIVLDEFRKGVIANITLELPKSRVSK